MKPGRFIFLESGLLALIFLAPLAFGSVYSWANMSFSGFIFLLFLFYPEAIFQVQTLPRPFLFGSLSVFAWIALQFLFISMNRYSTGEELIKWLAVASGFLLIQLLPGPSLLRLVYAVGLIGVVESLYGLFQTGSGNEKVLWAMKEAHRGYITGTYFNRNHFAGLIELALGAQLGLLLQSFERRKIQGMLLPAVCLIITLLAFLKSGSRAGIVSFGTALLFFSLVLVWRKNLLPKFLFLFFIILCGGAVFFAGGQAIAARFLNFGYDERLFVWQDALKILQQYPWTGIGLGTFEWVFPFFQSEKLAMGWAHAHNDYLELAAELGLPACLGLLFSFGFLWARCFLRLFPLSETTSFSLIWGLLISITSLALHAFVDFNFAIWANVLLFVFLFGVLFRLLNLSDFKETVHAG